jgi:hypothetical protein
MKEEELQTRVEEERDQLTAEIRRLEAALIEAKEVTSVKAVEDAHDEFAVKLRESRKQKSRPEEELEDQADRARTERRRKVGDRNRGEPRETSGKPKVRNGKPERRLRSG